MGPPKKEEERNSLLASARGTGQTQTGDPALSIEEFFETLTDEEWGTWAKQIPESFKGNHAEIKRLTGKIPLFVTFFINCKASDFDSAGQVLMEPICVNAFIFFQTMGFRSHQMKYHSGGMSHTQFFYFFL